MDLQAAANLAEIASSLIVIGGLGFGILQVHRRMVSLEMVWELMGGVTLDVWRRLQPWTVAKRLERDSPKFNEWAQWLAERFDDFNKCCAQTPAYQAYADWRPRDGGPLA